MANTVLASTLQVELDHVFSAQMTDFSCDGDRPVTVKYGAQGPIGSSRGQEKITGSFKLAVPANDKLEFDIVALMKRAEGFTVNFPIGLERHALYGVQLSKRGVSVNYETGNVEYSGNFTATEWVRLA